MGGGGPGSAFELFFSLEIDSKFSLLGSVHIDMYISQAFYCEIVH